MQGVRAHQPPPASRAALSVQGPRTHTHAHAPESAAAILPMVTEVFIQCRKVRSLAAWGGWAHVDTRMGGRGT